MIPFNGLLGDSDELRVIAALLDDAGLECSSISSKCDITEERAMAVLSKLKSRRLVRTIEGAHDSVYALETCEVARLLLALKEAIERLS